MVDLEGKSLTASHQHSRETRVQERKHLVACPNLESSKSKVWGPQGFLLIKKTSN